MRMSMYERFAYEDCCCAYDKETFKMAYAVWYKIHMESKPKEIHVKSKDQAETKKTRKCFESRHDDALKKAILIEKALREGHSKAEAAKIAGYANWNAARKFYRKNVHLLGGKTHA